MEKKGTLDFTKIFPEMGMKFTGKINDSGQPVVIDEESGQEGAYDIGRVSGDILSSLNEGRDPESQIKSLDELNIQFNTPKDAVPISPSSLAERFKLKAGAYTTSGLMKKLKNEYEAVNYDEDKGIVVKENGVWRTFDPGLIQSLSSGDPWEITKEIGKDIAEFAPGFAARAGAGAVGAAKGAAIGSVAGPVGSIAGAIAGGAAGVGAVAAADTTLGKLQGTYDATPGEQLADVALETTLSAAGYAIPFAVKPTKELITQAFRKIGNSASKSVFAQLLGATVGKPPAMMERLFNKPKLINNMIDATRGKGYQAADDLLTARATNQVKTVMGNVQKGLSKEFGKKEVEFLKTLGDDFSADITPAVQRTMAQLQSGTGVGLVNPITQTAKDGTKKLTGYKPVSLREFRELMGPDVPGISLSKAYRGLNEITRQGNQALSTGGKASAKQILELRRSLDDFVYNSRIMTDDKVDEFLRPIAQSYRSDLIGVFEKANPQAAQMYRNMNSFYKEGLEDAVQAGKILTGTKTQVDAKAQSFLNSLLNKDTSLPNRDFLQRASKYAFGDEMMGDRVLDTAAAKAFLPYVERAGFTVGAVSIGTGMLAGGAIGGIPGLAIGTAAGLAASSPRIAARAVNYISPNQAKAILPYSKVLMKSIKSMGKEAQDQLLVRPVVLSQMINSTVGQAMTEDSKVLQLLQDSGAIVREGPQQ